MVRLDELRACTVSGHLINHAKRAQAFSHVQIVVHNQVDFVRALSSALRVKCYAAPAYSTRQND